MTVKELIARAYKVARLLEEADAALLREMATRLDVTYVALSEAMERSRQLESENANLLSFINTECFVNDGVEYDYASTRLPLTPATDKRLVELKDENEYIRNRFKETDRMFGKNLLVMKAAIIEWRTTGDAKNGMAWIFNTLFGPGELPDEDERDAQAYFDREYESIDKELMELHKWFYERHKRAEPA
ncbi:hypothetical protein AC791_15560 [Klebsiella sp. RIT-PI-d]|nr:hypothetical protein AC791_15560 [Klebsiella sp. RIT-PI-d]